MPFGTDVIPGSFVYINNGNDFTRLTTDPWSLSLPPEYDPTLPPYTPGDDMFLKASFSSPVPLPRGLQPVSVGLAAAGLLRERRRRGGAPRGERAATAAPPFQVS
jgi:hypothetical protein